jgi:membrane protease YdiL (CAAX protease family)
LTNSTFLNLASLGTNKWWRTILVVLSMILGQVIGALGYELNYIRTHPDLSIKQILDVGSRGDIATFSEILAVFLVTLLTFWASYQFLHKRKASTTIFAGSKFSWRLYFQGFFTYTLIIIGVLLLTSQKELTAFVTNFTIEKFVTTALIGFVAFGIQSFTEEVLFRGYVFQMLSRFRWPIVWPVAMQAIIFGLLHLPSGVNNWISATAIGFTFGMITLWHNRLEFAAGAHNANNLMIAVVIGDIGKELSKGFDPTINGPDLLTSFVSMLLLAYFAYKLGNKGNLAKVID